MTDMMTATGWNPGFTLLWGLHVLSVFAFGVGIVFLVMLAIRTFTPAQLKSRGIWLIVAGAIVCLITVGVRGGPWTLHGAMRAPAGMQCGSMMNGMMHSRMEGMMERMTGGHDEHEGGDMTGMSMDDMAAMLEGKTGDAFDKAFLEGMIPHHQGAIDMARAAQTAAKHGEIREMAIDIMTTQQREIDMMRAWQREWGYIE
jgi:hypothetical protein